MKKKSIDKLYQEKLQDFGQTPDEHVWESIDSSLDRKKKKRRIIPLWWQIGGVAAVIAIVLYISVSSNDQWESDPILTETENTPSSSPSENAPTDATILDVVPKETSVASTTEANETKEKNVISSTSIEESTSQLSSVKSSPEHKKLGEQLKDNIVSEPSTALAKDKSFDEQPILKEERNNAVSNQPAEDSRLAASEVIKNTSEDQSPVFIAKKEAEILEEGKMDKTIALIEDQGETALDNKKEDNKKSIFEEVEKDAILAENNQPKWSMGPKVAPVFFSSLAQGSPIHSSFDNNSKSGNVNFSYGVTVSYNISKKLQVRSGIHKVDYGYDTNDVSFSSSLNAATNSLIDNIDYSLSSKNLVVKSNLSSRQAVSSNAMDVSAADPSLDGRMIQEFGYLEIPVELTYALIDKKIGVNVIGGVSSLFLTNNSVILESEGIATQMGEANNINDLNLSTNIGIGISYRVGNNMQVNLEPMFKYQLNTFSNATGNFQPYSLGVYSGLNFKF